MNIEYYKKILSNWDKMDYKTPEIKEHYYHYYKSKLLEAVKSNSKAYHKVVLTPIIGGLIQSLYHNYLKFKSFEDYEAYYACLDDIRELAWTTGVNFNKLKNILFEELKRNSSEFDIIFRLIAEDVIKMDDYKMVKKNG